MTGYNESEKYLIKMCDRTFLSLYSYPNVFRRRTPASELCDLLVVVGDDIIIFSDKHCVYGNHEKPEVNWKRWFKSAVIASAKQLWGAESWIKQFPADIYLDPKNTLKFPINISISPSTRIHLILVAHGTQQPCRDALGGIGSPIIDTSLKLIEDHDTPFIMGDISGRKTFVHILDDVAFELILTCLDTVTDFVNYINKREKFLKSGFLVQAAGEEELLADYLQTLDVDKEHNFTYPKPEFDGVSLIEGSWEKFVNSPHRHAQQEADKISYFWDNLIEEFSKHAINRSQHYVSEGGFVDAERAIRFMAREPRFSRRYLSKSFIDILTKTSGKQQLFRIMDPQLGTGIYYVFAALPHHNPKTQSYKEYRSYRLDLLQSYCLVLRLIRPDAKYVIGIGMESGIDVSKRAEDLICFDCSSWNYDLQKYVQELQAETGILTRYKRTEFNDTEYPRQN
ncbi:hypothetical protein [Dyadobacter diqingensis]|uniref:hypothetical protein n=1 Tax=Dyadobacter diqingensis TaxID=2938121 RepID=UPI0020C21B96|nr:hypothetical protein [Dyadobacter diqingensis]